MTPGRRRTRGRRASLSTCHQDTPMPASTVHAQLAAQIEAGFDERATLSPANATARHRRGGHSGH